LGELGKVERSKTATAQRRKVRGEGRIHSGEIREPVGGMQPIE
jgi:hypothetical protein